ncbi:hypothetical protein ACO22_07408 [Paracoccidioides brasiliensis]|uniref:Uncharacterized protein n=1 Tax=Paracoccidioides brasiliensis TaxID=121759 RepID=A0A1D2J4S6_PARBR|nr:hypothetical protein ACO22_07408 [Paracoccidioides brasiliensis]
MEGNVDIPITPPTLLPIDPDIEYDESDNGIPVLSSNVSIEHSIADDESNGLTMLNDSFSGSSSSSFGPSGDTSVAEYILAANTWIFMLVGETIMQWQLNPLEVNALIISSSVCKHRVGSHSENLARTWT